VNLAWDACASEGGVQNKTFACDTNSGSRVMVASFVLGSSMSNFIGIEALVDISADADSLPTWWQVFGAGDCRAAMSTSFSFESGPNTSCTDPWSGQGVGGIGAYHTFWTTPQVPGGAPATAQVVLTAAVPHSQPIELSADTEYYAFKLMLSLTKSVGSSSCSGCNTPVCLTLSQIRAVGSDNSSQALADAITSSTITWQSASDCPGAFASQNMTWGRIRTVLR
jgi:hypothetical protein